MLAAILNFDKASLNRVIAGKRTVDAELSIALENVFGVPAERFLELQKAYDLAQARLTARPDPGMATRAHLFGRLPVAEMMKRTWISVGDPKSIPQVEAALTKFFGVKSPDEIEILPHAAKKTNVTADVTPAQLAWLYRVKAIAKEMIVGKYSPDSARDAVGKLKALLSSAEEVRKVPRILAESGIRYVIVECITGAKIDGVCFWLNATSPVIGMSLRHDRIDNFWFVLRHELEHVLRLDGQTTVMMDIELEGARAGTGSEIPAAEQLANLAAADFCVPQGSLDKFIARKAPFFAERDILGFARTLQIHPGLVAGQLQHRTSRYDRFRAHQVKIRSKVAPSALVDGWGDTVPVDEG